MRKKRKDNKEIILVITFVILFILIIYTILFSSNNDLLKKSPSQQTINCQKETVEKFLFDKDRKIILSETSSLQDLTNGIIKDKKINLFSERKKLLIKTMYDNPEAALFSTFTEEQRNKIKDLSKNCVENTDIVEGYLEVWHFDNFEHKLITKNKETINLHPAFGLKDNLISGMKIKVKGLRLDNELIFDGTRSTRVNDLFGGIDLEQTSQSQDYNVIKEIKPTIPPPPILNGIYITTNPSLAKIYLDDIYKGLSPLNIGLPKGTYNVKASKVGYYDESKTVNVYTGDITNVDLNLRPDYLLPQLVGDQRTLVVLVNFQDTNENIPTIEQVRDIIFNKLNNYYKENSYNQISLSGNVLGWYRIPITLNNCDISLIINEAIKAVDLDVNFNDYSRLIIVAPTLCNSFIAGLSSVGKYPLLTQDGEVQMSVSQITINSLIYSSGDFGAAGHELGHGFGNNHANFYECYGSSLAYEECRNIEYGDPYDEMGGGVILHFNAIHKDYMGWLKYSNIKTIDTISQNGVYTIEPIEVNTNNLQVLKIKRSENNYLYLEYRQPIGFDSDSFALDTGVFEGSLFHMPAINDFSNKYDYSYPLLIDATVDNQSSGDAWQGAILPVGNTLLDPLTGTTIETISKTPNSLTVDINFGPKTDFINPSISITSPEQNAQISGTVAITANANDESGIEKVEFYYFIFNLPWYPYYETVKFATDDDFPYQAVLDTTHLPNGNSFVIAKAYDLSGYRYGLLGNIKYSGILYSDIKNIDLIPPEVVITFPESGIFYQRYSWVELRTEATDNNGIYKIEYYKNDATLPFNVEYAYNPEDSNSYYLGTEYPFGKNMIYAKAYDFVGNVAVSNNVTIYIGVCSDESQLNQCSLNKPLYCDSNGNLIKRCSACGCKNGLCISDGSCLVSGSGKGKNIATP